MARTGSNSRSNRPPRPAKEPSTDGAVREPVGSVKTVSHWNCSICPFWSADPDEVDAHIDAGNHLPEPGSVVVPDKARSTHASPTREQADQDRAAEADDDDDGVSDEEPV